MLELPEYRAACVWTELLVGKADGGGLAAAFQYPILLYRWVKRRVTWPFVFFDTHNLPSPAMERQFSIAHCMVTAKIVREISNRMTRCTTHPPHARLRQVGQVDFTHSQSFSETALVRGVVPAIRSPNLCQA